MIYKYLLVSPHFSAGHTEAATPDNQEPPLLDRFRDTKTNERPL